MTEYQKTVYPKSRRGTFDVGRIAYRKHHVAGFLEVDVTLARKKIKERVRAGEEISFISWLIKVYGTTIYGNRYIHGINSKKRSQILFKDVDISMPIERVVEGVKVPLALVIRKTQDKSVSDIYRELQKAQTGIIENEKDYVLEKSQNPFLTRLFFNLPQVIRLCIWRFILNNPFSLKKHMGTAVFTNTGMTGSFSGWILPKSLHNLCLAMGTLIKKPCVKNNEIVIRDILHLTLLFDHDVVDGAPAARFTDKLVRNLERGMEL